MSTTAKPATKSPPSLLTCAKIVASPDVTLDELREAATMLEEIEPTARRVLGAAHPTTADIERALQHARAALRTRDTPPPGTA